MTINKLFTIVQNRIKPGLTSSYTFTLINQGLDRVAQKVGEEAVEVVIAAKNMDKQRLISEIADLWFHSLILLAVKGVNPKLIFDELDRRHSNKS